MSMYYNWQNSAKFKPLINNALANYEVTKLDNFKVGETYLIELKPNITWDTNEKKSIKLKGEFVKSYEGSRMTYMICKDSKGRVFSVPVQESRFYYSPDNIIVNRIRQEALVICINNATMNIPSYESNSNSAKYSIGNDVGKCWIHDNIDNIVY